MLLVAETFEYGAQFREDDDGHPHPDVGFDPPSLDDQRAVPWGGPGPDPLEQMWEAS